MAHVYQCDWCGVSTPTMDTVIEWYSVAREGINVDAWGETPWEDKLFCGRDCLYLWGVQYANTPPREVKPSGEEES